MLMCVINMLSPTYFHHIAKFVCPTCSEGGQYEKSVDKPPIVIIVILFLYPITISTIGSIPMYYEIAGEVRILQLLLNTV